MLRYANVRHRLTLWYVGVFGLMLLLFIFAATLLQYWQLTRQLYHAEIQDIETAEGLLAFAPDGRLAPIGKSPDGSFTPHLLTVDGWIETVAKRGNAILKEHQVKVKTETWGHLAHLWSTYELNVDPAGSPTIRGINSIQAFYDGKQWKVLEILWQAESADEKVPERYLP